jgi:hypothetical protein
MSNVIDLKKSVHDICKKHPKVLEIMKELGFDSITKPGMLNTMGKFMTIEKGAQMKGIALEKIKKTFADEGFEILE